MNKLLILVALVFTPLVVNATYSNHNKHHSGHHNKHHSGHHNKHKGKAYGNPLVGHKMPKGCKWVWVNGKKETKCGNNNKTKLAKFCKKYPGHKKCKKKDNPVSVSEPAPLALLSLGLVAAFFARRK